MINKIKVGVFGASGRVGKELLALIQQSEDLVASCGIGKEAAGFENNYSTIDELKPRLADIYIDFSAPTLFEKAIQYCMKEKVPFVSGTTGLNPQQFDLIQKAGAEIPVLWAPNMSLGIATLKKALSVFKGIKDFDFQMEEWHHRHKKDSPSGTALYLQKALEENIEKECPPTMVMRAGGIYGVHKIYAVSDEEIIQFEHTAINRTVFARGAIKAALWLKDKSPGIYAIDDVIS